MSLERLVPNLTPYDKTNGQAGLVAPTSRLWAPGATAVTASRAYLVRFVPSRPMTIASVAFVVTTLAGADDACDVGIYDSAFARLGSAGATTGQLNSTGVKNVAMTATVKVAAGVAYYAAVSTGAQGGTAASLIGAGFVSSNAVDLFGTAGGVREATFMAAAHPLPATITPGGSISTSMMLAVRES